MQRLRRRGLVLHHGDADVVRAGIGAIGLIAREIAPGHHAHAGLSPQLLGHGFAAAMSGNVEPEKEAARRPLVAVAVADDLVGEIELCIVEPAVLFDVAFVAIGGDRDVLRRHRHLRRRDVAQFEKGGEEILVAGGKADAQARQVRALRQRMEYDHVVEVGRGRFQHARRRVLAVDLTIALVGKDEKAVAPRQRGELVEIGAVRHRALRVRRRGEVEDDGTLEQRFVERVEVGQECAFARRRQIDRLAMGRERARRISGIERIGDQHRRLADARGHPALRGNRGEKQAFTGAIEHQHFAVRIHRTRQRIAAAEPLRDGLAERLDALVGRIAAEVVEMLRQHRADEGRDRMLRLADREVDHGLAGRDAGDQVGQPHERRAGFDPRGGGGGRRALC